MYLSQCFSSGRGPAASDQSGYACMQDAGLDCFHCATSGLFTVSYTLCQRVGCSAVYLLVPCCSGIQRLRSDYTCDWVIRSDTTWCVIDAGATKFGLVAGIPGLVVLWPAVVLPGICSILNYHAGSARQHMQPPDVQPPA